MAKSANHTLYHLAPRGFWKKFRDVLVVNPEISSGLPIPKLNRYPQPGSRTEEYATPATRASDPAENPYWKRDVRRAYPQLSVVTQSELSRFLLASPELKPAVEQPSAPAADASTFVPVAQEKPAVDLTQAIATLAAARKAYSAGKLPPTPPNPFPSWTPARAEDAPHDPETVFPMELYK